MNATKYIQIQCIQVNDRFIPLLDANVDFVNDTFSAPYYSYKNMGSYLPITCLLNVSTKEISTDVVIDIYQPHRFKVGETVYYTISRYELQKTKVKEVKYTDYTLQVMLGKDLDEYSNDILRERNIKIELDTLYSFKTWRCEYVLENGIVSKSYLDLYKLIREHNIADITNY